MITSDEYDHKGSNTPFRFQYFGSSTLYSQKKHELSVGAFIRHIYRTFPKMLRDKKSDTTRATGKFRRTCPRVVRTRNTSDNRPNWTKFRWIPHLLADLTGSYAYRTWIVILTTVVAAYFGAYAVMESRHDRQMNRAMFERNTFITMVSSGEPGTFVAAMKNFGPVQTMAVPKSPPVFPPWNWFGTAIPNVEPLWRWAVHRFMLCTTDECGIEGSRITLRSSDLRYGMLNTVDLNSADLTYSVLSHVDLSAADLSDAVLTYAVLTDAVLFGAVLRRADLTDARLTNANLGGAVLTDAVLTRVDFSNADLFDATLNSAAIEHLRSAYWNEHTTWPEGLVPPCTRSSPDTPCLRSWKVDEP